MAGWLSGDHEGGSRGLGILLVFLVLGTFLLNTGSHVAGNSTSKVPTSPTKALSLVSKCIALRNADTKYPNNVGSAADPWDNWDGCSPIEASMVVAYYDSQFRTPNLREAIIDILHFTMGTNSKGGTEPDGILKGIEDFYWEATKLYREGYLGVHPTYGYDAKNHKYYSDYQLFLATKCEVDNNHPSLLNVFWGLSNGRIVGHSMTFC
ncbi:hypothetical protein ADU37_CDS07190 [Thermococcus sp. 2319x1]|uniref:hypothetical protein n=1 Tax=Thermococcus sp. 2319x1 TaxID=1674923 RepID=UPI00073ADE4E|nr:hypothetical protein [Thermococcus sp. 2319x1]ALV62418.1 hypothetical protein ADU37_CDS07190 [Thermococcus sp. 2319x1]